jgi:hypothetical protein
MDLDELKAELKERPVDINGEFQNPIKLVQSDSLFNDCVGFWKGLDRGSDTLRLCAHLGTLTEVDISKLRSIQWGIKAEKVEAILGNPQHLQIPVAVVKTKKGLVLLDGNTRAFIKSKLGDKTIDAYVIELKKSNADGSKLFESVLDENQSFYSLVSEELHGQKDVEISSDEPNGSNVSCFSYDHEDQEDDSFGEEDTEDDGMHRWHGSKVTMDDDGLYWESESGHKGCLTLYCIVKAEFDPGHITLWVAPKDSGTDMGVVHFRKSK